MRPAILALGALVPALIGACSQPGVRVARPVSDLPATEFEAVSPDSAVIGVQVTGDSGWGQLDRHVAGVLARRGIAVTSLNSFRYFWEPKTPEQMASDINRLIGATLERHARDRVVLVG